MLPVTRRVKKEFFSEIMKRGSLARAGHFYQMMFKRQDRKPALFSFVVPAKIEKTSVGRHRLKRKMTAVVEKNISAVGPGLSVIIFATAGASLISYAQLEKEIMGLLTKSGALN